MSKLGLAILQVAYLHVFSEYLYIFLLNLRFIRAIFLLQDLQFRLILTTDRVISSHELYLHIMKGLVSFLTLRLVFKFKGIIFPR